VNEKQSDGYLFNATEQEKQDKTPSGRIEAFFDGLGYQPVSFF
jgi:hypothetical protein